MHEWILFQTKCIIDHFRINHVYKYLHLGSHERAQRGKFEKKILFSLLMLWTTWNYRFCSKYFLSDFSPYCVLYYVPFANILNTSLKTHKVTLLCRLHNNLHTIQNLQSIFNAIIQCHTKQFYVIYKPIHGEFRFGKYLNAKVEISKF